MDDTKLTAHLPGFDIEITRVPGDEDEETMLIRMNARPSFAFFGRVLTDPTALPKLAAAPLAVVGNPFDIWMDLWRAGWLPWLNWLRPQPWLGRRYP